MDWHFTEIDHDSRHLKNASELTVSARSELSDLEIFAREVIQNSLDNRASVDPVRVDFRLKSLKGEQKDEFLKLMKFSEISRRVKAIRDYDSTRKQRSDFPDPASVLAKDYVLRLLYVEDFGTRGLVGPEHSFEVHRFPQPHCFLGLCRNTGDSQKTAATAGGIYGLGKTVLWKHSPLRTVFFHSRMSTPYKLLHTQAERWTRFFGHVKLTGHHVGEQAYTGDGYWGARRGLVTWSLMEEEAERCARNFGMTIRNKTEAGTSILIVDFQDPDAEGGASDLETLQRLRNAVEEYYWPALTEGTLTVRTRAEDREPDWQTRDVIELPHLAPFLKCYIFARSGQSRAEIYQKPITLHLPNGPDPGQGKCKASVLAVTMAPDESDKAATRFRNRTALIRGSGMVVGYKNFARAGLGKNDFYSIVLGGKSCPAEHSEAPENQDRCEQFLAYSEPVTHDDWTVTSENLKKWYGSKAELRRMLDQIKKAIAEATAELHEPEGTVASLLSNFFPLAAGTERETVRDMHVEFLQNPGAVSCGDGLVKYEFAIRLRVPARQNFNGPAPAKWKIECRFGFYGEDVRRKVVEDLAAGFTDHKKDGSGWERLDDFLPSFEGPVEDSDLCYDFRGETAPMMSSLAASTKQELQIKILKRFQS